MSTPTDNTTLNPGASGDTIATEDNPAGSSRGSSDAPTTDYKLPRSKLAVGQYGIDKGDATAVNPLGVGTLHERRMLEDAFIEHTNNGRMSMSSLARGRIDRLDRRGGNGHRGVR